MTLHPMDISQLRAKVIYPISLPIISITMNGKLTIFSILSRHDTLKEIAEM